MCIRDSSIGIELDNLGQLRLERGKFVAECGREVPVKEVYTEDLGEVPTYWHCLLYTSLQDVGFYNAGIMILNGYFGVIITALTTDYYPRIASISDNNIFLQNELNKQATVSLVLCCPLVVLFLFLLPFFIRVLYSEEFFLTVNFIRVAIWGTLITICSNQVYMILVCLLYTSRCV